MPITPDRFPGPLEDEELRLTPDASDPAVEGAVKFNGTDFRMKDASGVFNPRTGGSGLTEEGHKALRQLIHFIDDGPGDGFTTELFKETLPAGNPFPTQEIWWESNAKLKKIVSLDITRNANKTPSFEVWKVYDTDGVTVLKTVTDSISYSGVIETARGRAIS